MNRLLGRLGVRHREHVSVARDFSVYSAVNVASLVLLLSINLLLRRSLGPYFAGIWSALDLLPGYAAFAHLGILNAAERELPFLIGAKRTRDFDGTKHTLLWLTHGIGLLLATTVVIGAVAFRDRLSRPTFIGLLLYAPYLWAQLLATYYLVLYRARRRFVALSQRQGAANFVKAVLMLTCGYTFGLFGVLGAVVAASLLLVALLHGGLDETFERVFERARILPLLKAGVPILAGGAAFETLRPGGTTGADQVIILATLGAAPLGAYSVTAIVCQGLFYLPNALSTVMYPRFQERYSQTQSATSLRKFVEVQLHVLADVLLAAITVLLVALPPAIAAFLPKYVDTIAPLRVMLVATYFVALAPPAGQFLLTIHKQNLTLFIAVPVTALAFVAGSYGAAYGLVGVAVGVAVACVVEFLAINIYALLHFSKPVAVIAQLGTLCGTAAAWLLAVVAVERFVPAGPPVIALVGGWRLVVVGLLCLPLLVRATRRIQALQVPDLVDNVRAGH